MLNIFKKKNENKGFTLVEMLVSVSVFIVVITITMGTLLVVNDALRKTRLLRNTMENVNIAMESMVKRMRTGSEYDCNPSTPAALEDCPPTLVGGGSGTISFVGADGKTYQYRESNGALRVSIDGGDLVSITSPEIEITSLRFYVSNNDEGVGSSDGQARVIVTMTGFADIPGKAEFDTEFALQTMVSKRVPDSFDAGFGT